jgi:hypothetical protein
MRHAASSRIKTTKTPTTKPIGGENRVDFATSRRVSLFLFAVVCLLAFEDFAASTRLFCVVSLAYFALRFVLRFVVITFAPVLSVRSMITSAISSMVSAESLTILVSSILMRALSDLISVFVVDSYDVSRSVVRSFFRTLQPAVDNSKAATDAAMMKFFIVLYFSAQNGAKLIDFGQ